VCVCVCARARVCCWFSIDREVTHRCEYVMIVWVSIIDKGEVVCVSTEISLRLYPTAAEVDVDSAQREVPGLVSFLLPGLHLQLVSYCPCLWQERHKSAFIAQ
jgi:hypothetical protein